MPVSALDCKNPGFLRAVLCYNQDRGDAALVEGIVTLIIYYVIFMILGDLADYFIGLVVERVWPQASLSIFLALYFLFLWVAWIGAVKMTEPTVAVAPTA